MCDREAGPEPQLVGLRGELGGAPVQRSGLLRLLACHQLVGVPGQLIGTLQAEQARELPQRLAVILHAQVDPSLPRLAGGGYARAARRTVARARRRPRPRPPRGRRAGGPPGHPRCARRRWTWRPAPCPRPSCSPGSSSARPSRRRRRGCTPRPCEPRRRRARRPRRAAAWARAGRRSRAASPRRPHRPRPPAGRAPAARTPARPPTA